MRRSISAIIFLYSGASTPPKRRLNSASCMNSGRSAGAGAVGGDVVDGDAAATARVGDFLVESDGVGQWTAGAGGESGGDDEVFGEMIAAVASYLSLSWPRPVGGCGEHR